MTRNFFSLFDYLRGLCTTHQQYFAKSCPKPPSLINIHKSEGSDQQANIFQVDNHLIERYKENSVYLVLKQRYVQLCAQIKPNLTCNGKVLISNYY
ncbi:hypothetical protein FGO68_gene11660 [Halteria grandinella]|uniref:Uncharacterized protein n=1 Tax=Halteria grandinella TaxID=5974 RepID=A0A8J8NEQ1_HALGN|nr:hypothetical protein FGO68_gene11660 [Halteria grandinella]